MFMLPSQTVLRISGVISIRRVKILAEKTVKCPLIDLGGGEDIPDAHGMRTEIGN